MTEWKTAAEWAAEGLAGLPSTKSGFIRLAKREGWDELGPSFARKRKQSGGGWEYHVSCLPEAAQADWAKRQDTAKQVAAVEERAVSTAQALAAAPPSLSARRREVMQARAAVLIEVDRRMVDGIGWDKAMRGLLAAAASGDVKPGLRETLALACDRKRGDLPSPRTFYNWKKAQAAGGIHALAPARSEQQTKAPPPVWLDAFLRHYGKTGVTLTHALDLYAKTLPPKDEPPTYAQVQRAVKALAGTDRFLDAFRGREGPLKLKARLGFKRRTIEGMDPGTVYTADGKTFDATVAHPMSGQPFRPEITTVIDVVTRRLVGWSVGLAESGRVVADALRRACEFGGIPAILYTDNGAGYKNQDLDHETLGMAASLGIMTTHSLPYNSQARGIIERANGTIWNRLAQEFVTYQGPLVDREHRQKVFKKISRDVKEFGTSPLLPSWPEFVAAVERAVAEYNARPHSSLKISDPATGRMRKASPDEVWADFMAKGFEPVTLTPDEADDLFRPTVIRKVARGEVKWNNNQYFHPALEPFHGMDVLVGIDITDGSRVWVRRIDMIDGEPRSGALICVAEYWMNKAHYMPVSMEQAAMEKRHRSRLRRVEDKRAGIDAELHGALLEYAPPVPAAFDMQPSRVIDMAPAPQPASAIQVERAGLPGRKVHSSYIPHEDVELAAESLADPSTLTPGRIRILREFIEYLGGRYAEEALRAGGVDPDALRNLLRSAAA